MQKRVGGRVSRIPATGHHMSSLACFLPTQKSEQIDDARRRPGPAHPPHLLHLRARARRRDVLSSGSGENKQATTCGVVAGRYTLSVCGGGSGNRHMRASRKPRIDLRRHTQQDSADTAVRLHLTTSFLLRDLRLASAASYTAGVLDSAGIQGNACFQTHVLAD